jgi:peptidyl-prolyl cis-trans isomerase B (cyclophilin B)
MKRIITLLLACLMLAMLPLSFTSCGNVPGYKKSKAPTDYVRINVTYVHNKYQKVTGDIVVQLRGDVAPITVENFKNLVADKFYDGLTFHRVMSGFMIQGGCPKGDGTGNAGSTIKGEFSENGVENNLKHERGVISMARGNDMNSASSQFFIMHATNSTLDGKYAAFGNVVYGMETVDGIASTPTTYNTGGEKASPTNLVIINKVTFVTPK